MNGASAGGCQSSHTSPGGRPGSGFDGQLRTRERVRHCEGVGEQGECEGGQSNAQPGRQLDWPPSMATSVLQHLQVLVASLTIPLRTVSVCDDSNLPVWHHIKRLFRIRREELHVVLVLVETFNGIRPALLEELPCLRKGYVKNTASQGSAKGPMERPADGQSRPRFGQLGGRSEFNTHTDYHPHSILPVVLTT